MFYTFLYVRSCLLHLLPRALDLAGNLRLGPDPWTEEAVAGHDLPRWSVRKNHSCAEWSGGSLQFQKGIPATASDSLISILKSTSSISQSYGLQEGWGLNILDIGLCQVKQGKNGLLGGTGRSLLIASCLLRIASC